MVSSQYLQPPKNAVQAPSTPWCCFAAAHDLILEY